MLKELARWDPFREMTSLRSEFDRLFDSFFGRMPLFSGEETTWVPALDVEETENEYIVKAELPGMKKEDLKISVTENRLTVSGERKDTREEKGKTYHRVEIAYGKFQRSIDFPGEVNPNESKATYKEGILTVRIPKSERAKPRSLDVEVK